jgi:hypothetical protein
MTFRAFVSASALFLCVCDCSVSELAHCELHIDTAARASTTLQAGDSHSTQVYI